MLETLEDFSGWDADGFGGVGAYISTWEMETKLKK
jgi:hypothetical protein